MQHKAHFAIHMQIQVILSKATNPEYHCPLF